MSELDEWAAMGMVERAREIIMKTPGWESSSGEALRRAAGNGRVACVELLATQGNCMALDWFKQGALAHAVRSDAVPSKKEACALAVLDFSDALLGDLNGVTPLMHAVERMGKGAMPWSRRSRCEAMQGRRTQAERRL